MGIRFGPAGLGGVKTSLEVLEQYYKRGFRACEVAFTYSVYIKSEEAVIIGRKANELDIELSIHAPYFVNLNSAEPEKRGASRIRILKCCEIGNKLGAKVVVFHPGYYGKEGNKERDYNMIKSEVIKMMEVVKKNKWEVKLAPETMGKINVFGSVEEISRLVKDTGCSFCIDFAHILARDKKVDYCKIKKLFLDKEWHVHFSGITYGEKGEKHHRETEKKEWSELLKNLPKDKEIRIINESPKMVEDSDAGLEIWKKIS